MIRRVAPVQKGDPAVKVLEVALYLLAVIVVVLLAIVAGAELWGR